MTARNSSTTNPGRNAYDAAEHAARVKMVDPIREMKDGRDTTMTVPRWDRFLASKEAEQGGTFGGALATHGKSASWSAFARETFAKLYDSGLGRALADEEKPAGHDWVGRLHESAEALPEWRALRERARRDSWACGVAAGEALNVLAQTVTPPETDPQAIQDELDFVKQMMQEGGKTTPKHLKRMAALQRQRDDAMAEHARASQMLAAKAASLRSAMRGAAQKAQETIAEYDDAMLTLGAGDGGGIMSKVAAPPAQLRNTLLRNAKLRKILKLAGRMKSAAIQKQRTKARPGREELCDVKLGSELDRLLPSELVNLAEEDTEALLFRKLIENGAMTYELRGKENKAEGPIILAVDESGSMSGDPDMWAKAVAIALMEIAARQNRPFAYVHFASSVCRVDEVPNPKSFKLEQLEELVSYFNGGGTRIAVALAHCADMLDKAATDRSGKPWKRADVILITDGESGDDVEQAKAIERIRAQSGHLYTCFIGHESTDKCATMADEKMVINGDTIRSGDPTKLDKMFSI